MFWMNCNNLTKNIQIHIQDVNITVKKLRQRNVHFNDNILLWSWCQVVTGRLRPISQEMAWLSTANRWESSSARWRIRAVVIDSSALYDSEVEVSRPNCACAPVLPRFRCLLHFPKTRKWCWGNSCPAPQPMTCLVPRRQPPCILSNFWIPPIPAVLCTIAWGQGNIALHSGEVRLSPLLLRQFCSPKRLQVARLHMSMFHNVPYVYQLIYNVKLTSCTFQLP